MSGLEVVCVQPMQTMENPGIAGRGDVVLLKIPPFPPCAFYERNGGLGEIFRFALF